MKHPKPDPTLDPRLFEYFPEEVEDEEVYESMAELGVPPIEIVDPSERERYVAYLEKNGYST